jgi:hypothetical protein
MVQAKSEKDEFSAQGNSSSFESSGSLDDNLEFIDDPIQLYLKDIAQTRLLDAKEISSGCHDPGTGQISLYPKEEKGLDAESIFMDMCSTWEQVKRDALRLQEEAPDIYEVMTEAPSWIKKVKPG